MVEGVDPVLWVLLLVGFALVGLALSGLLTRLRGAVRAASPPALSIIVLAQNQEEQVEGFLRSLLALVHERMPPHVPVGVLLVDVGSSDQTRAILERLTVRYANAEVLSLPAEEADRACERALMLCRGRLVLLADLRAEADGAVVLSRIANGW
jgi:glycosyltransferase involved in cell wall biosynthesis